MFSREEGLRRWFLLPLVLTVVSFLLTSSTICTRQFALAGGTCCSDYGTCDGRCDIYKPCACTCHACAMRPDLYDACHSSYAQNWGNAARIAGFPVNANPNEGDIVVFQPGVYGASSLGHVAYVEDVNAGKFSISERGYISDPCNIYDGRQLLDVVPGIEFIHRKNSDPHLILNSAVNISPNPSDAGETVNISFAVKNIGDSTLHMDEIFVRSTFPNQQPDGDWKAWAVPVDIPAGKQRNFTASAPTWEGEPDTFTSYHGNWKIKEIIYFDTNRDWYSLDLNGHSLPSFQTNKPRVRIIADRTGVVVNSKWTKITFPYQMEGSGNDLVYLFANICSEKGSDTAHLDIKQPTFSHVWMRVEEDGGGWHGKEDICYLAVSQSATYFNVRGAENIKQPDPGQWHWVSYNWNPDHNYPMAANVSTEIGGDNVHLDLNTEVNGFWVRLEEDLHEDGSHGLERVDWINWRGSPPSGVRSGQLSAVTHEWRSNTWTNAFADPPVVIARITSENGPDCALTDLKEVGRKGFNVRVEECLPCGSCAHWIGERIAWMAVNPGVLEW